MVNCVWWIKKQYTVHCPLYTLFMTKIGDFLSGIKVLEEVDSPFNGNITVIKSIAFGVYMKVGGLTQSGGIIKEIWNSSLKKVHSTKHKVQRVLILGLGGGSIIQVVNKYWPDARITAVDIDSVMIELGKKYLKLDEKKVKVVISDAYKFLTVHRSLSTDHFDLICVDLYVGDKYPDKFNGDDFLKLISSALNPSGIAVINRLYYGEKRPESVKFGTKLEKFFKRVEVVYPEANIMFLCYN
jgi:spermidine synthase